jgi:hypothetical protein
MMLILREVVLRVMFGFGVEGSISFKGTLLHFEDVFQ